MAAHYAGLGWAGLGLAGLGWWWRPKHEEEDCCWLHLAPAVRGKNTAEGGGGPGQHSALRSDNTILLTFPRTHTYNLLQSEQI